MQSKSKVFLVSGLPPGPGGVGRLMKRLVEQAADLSNCEVIYRRANRNLSALLAKKRYVSLIGELIARVRDRARFFLCLLKIRNSKVIFIHPQTAGFKNLFGLHKRNKVFLYVMDCSFFCVRSYNCDPDTSAECIRCVGFDDSPKDGCQVFPSSGRRKSRLQDMARLSILSKSMVFLAQNKNQSKLLKKHFGSGVEVHVVGMDTGEMDLVPEKKLNVPRTIYDFVYHGSCELAKGLGLVIDVARELPEYSFFVPIEKQECEFKLGYSVELDNIHFVACDWEGGLREAVESSKITLNPSIWSAPIEGALLKSIHYGNKVAVAETKYGFAEEIAADCELIRLPLDAKESASVLRREIISLGRARANLQPLTMKKVNVPEFVNEYGSNNATVILDE